MNYIYNSLKPHLEEHTSEEIISRLLSLANWKQPEGIFSSLAASMEWLTIQNAVTVTAYLFFFVTLSVFFWQVYRYIGFVKQAVLLKKIGFRMIIQSFCTLYLVVVAALSAGINGFSGVFWVFSFIGFSLTLIFMMDRASKRGKKTSN